MYHTRPSGGRGFVAWSLAGCLIFVAALSTSRFLTSDDDRPIEVKAADLSDRVVRAASKVRTGIDSVIHDGWPAKGKPISEGPDVVAARPDLPMGMVAIGKQPGIPQATPLQQLPEGMLRVGGPATPVGKSAGFTQASKHESASK